MFLRGSFLVPYGVSEIFVPDDHIERLLVRILGNELPSGLNRFGAWQRLHTETPTPAQLLNQWATQGGLLNFDSSKLAFVTDIHTRKFIKIEIPRDALYRLLVVVVDQITSKINTCYAQWRNNTNTPTYEELFFQWMYCGGFKYLAASDFTISA